MSEMQKFNLYMFVWAVSLLVLAGLTFVAELAAPEARALIFNEGGVVETLSAIGHFGTVALLSFLIIRQKKTDGWSLCALLLCFGFRELDFDKRFTTMGIFKSRFYLSSEVMASEKAAGVLVILALVVCLYHLTKAHGRPFFRKLKALDPAAITLFLSLALLAAAKTLDGLPRKVRPLGIVLSSHAKMLSAAIEESLELVAPALMIVVILGALCSAGKRPGGSDLAETP